MQVNGALEDEPEEEENVEGTAGQEMLALEADEHVRAVQWCCGQHKGLPSEVLYLQEVG